MNLIKQSLELGGIICCSFTGYFGFITFKNRAKQKVVDNNADEFKDTTRPQYPSFGLPFGAGADLMVLEEIDSGDVVEYDKYCQGQLSIFSMFDCHARSVFNIPGNKKRLLTLRLPNEVLLYDPSTTKFTEYSKLLRSIDIEAVQLYKLKYHDQKFQIKIHKELKDKYFNKESKSKVDENLINLVIQQQVDTIKDKNLCYFKKGFFLGKNVYLKSHLIVRDKNNL